LDITYLGAGAVRLSGKNINVVCDPYDGSAGLGKLSVRADVVTKSGPEGFGTIEGAMVIEAPGAYEVKGSMITGVPACLHIDEAGSRATVFSLLIDGVNVVVTGNIAGKIDDKEVESLGKVDVLVVPVGGRGLTLDAEGAASVVAQLEPSYVVPVHYEDPSTTYPMPQANVEEFLKEMGSSPEPTTKLKVNAKEFPEETQVVLLTRV
jgi:L-ascorbate metabolism protein UlaG (beta-lactamase superfamily)